MQTAQEWTKSYIELIASYVQPKTSNHLRSHLRAIMALDHRGLIGPRKTIRPNFLPANLGACKPAFYTIYASILRWNSIMRPCFYHSDLGQNAVFHNFAIQIALIQYSGRSNRSTRGLLANPLKKCPISPIRPAGPHFCSASCGRIFKWTLAELRTNIIKNLLCLFFI